MNPSPKLVGPVLFVQDIERSKQFYCDLLGQQVEIDFGACVGLVGGLALWELNRASEIVYGTPGRVSLGGGPQFELNFETADVRATWEQVKDIVSTIVHPVVEQPWGQLVFRATDPDGHLFEVGEPIPIFVKRFSDQGMSDEQVAVRTSVPLPIVRAILQGSHPE